MVVFYELERHDWASSLAQPVHAPAGLTTADGEPIVCSCLQVTESTVVRAVRDGGARSLCELAASTGAGGGCTACHRRLRHYLAEGRDHDCRTHRRQATAAHGS